MTSIKGWTVGLALDQPVPYLQHFCPEQQQVFHLFPSLSANSHTFDPQTLIDYFNHRSKGIVLVEVGASAEATGVWSIAHQGNLIPHAIAQGCLFWDSYPPDQSLADICGYLVTLTPSSGWSIPPIQIPTETHQLLQLFWQGDRTVEAQMQIQTALKSLSLEFVEIFLCRLA